MYSPRAAPGLTSSCDLPYEEVLSLQYYPLYIAQIWLGFVKHWVSYHYALLFARHDISCH